MVGEHLKPGARPYTDEAKAYEGMGEHGAVNHSAREYVGEQVHMNGLESLEHSEAWLLRHLPQDVVQAPWGVRCGICPSSYHGWANTMEQMGNVVRWMAGKGLGYGDLIATDGLGISGLEQMRREHDHERHTKESKPDPLSAQQG